MDGGGMFKFLFKKENQVETLIFQYMDTFNTALFFKLQFKELVLDIGGISDHAKRVSKRVNILTLKRRV